MRPGVVFVGLGFFAIASIIHCIPIGSAHMSVAPMMFSLPGTHTQWFVPGRNTVILPSGPISVTVASRVMQSGPDRSARRSLAFAISSDMVASPFIWFHSLARGGAPTLGAGPTCCAQPAADDRPQAARLPPATDPTNSLREIVALRAFLREASSGT